MAEKYYASNIDWDVGNDEILETANSFDDARFAEIFGISKDAKNADDIVLDKVHHMPALINDMFDLPDEIEIPAAIYEAAIIDGDYEAITDWISEEYCFLVNNYSISEELEKRIDFQSTRKQLGKIIKEDTEYV